MIALALYSALASTPADSPDWLGAHGRQRLLMGADPSAPTPPNPGALPPATPGPDVRVYGYLAYWDDDLGQVPWDELSDLAIFSANVDTAGNLSSTSNWDQAATAVSMAAPYGVKIHLCVTNFSSGELETLLGSTTARSNLISQLASWEAGTGADGINIDFENMPAIRKDEMVQFIADLDAAVGDVVIATPAVDWSSAWDYSALTANADLFIMGYGYHWSGSAEAGPTDTLYGGTGTVWASNYALDWTVGDYLSEGADPSRVILGLPLYGRAYYTSNNNVPTASNGDGGAVTWSAARPNLAGATLEPTGRSMYYYDGSQQTWVNDVSTMRDRLQFAVGEGIGGVGFWAINYDNQDAALWTMIHDETTFGVGDADTDADTDSDTDVDTDTDSDADADPPVSPDFVALTGEPLLAYVGDVVVLNADDSYGPEGVPLVFAWTRTHGPEVAFDALDIAKPSFRVPEPGNYGFRVRVGDGNRMSAPADTFVVVIDPAAKSSVGARGCGCATGAPASGGLLLMGLAALVRRRSKIS